MIDEALRRRLWRRTLEALAPLARESTADGPLRVGDLFVAPATSAWPVLWAIVDETGAGQGRFLAVPADTHPLLGSGDVALPQDAPWGPLRLRCRLGVWVEAAVLAPAKRCGGLEPDQLAAARRRFQAIAAAETDRSLPDHQVDGDLDYREWCEETLAPAGAALARRAAEPPPSRAGAHRLPRQLRLAASVLLLLGLGGVLGALWTARWMDGVAPEGGASTTIANPVLVWLAPRERTRGEVDAVTVPPGADGVALLLRVRSHHAASSYRLEIRRQPSDELVWGRDGLLKTSEIEIPVVLPRSALPPGRYRLLLFSEEATEAGPLAEYALEIGDR